MRTADIESASAELDLALRETPGSVQLYLIKAKLLEAAGEVSAAAAVLDAGLEVAPANAVLRAAASHLAITLDGPEQAAFHADAAARVSSDLAVLAAVCTARLSLGKTAEASETASSMLTRAPHDQMAWALQTTAGRLLEDPRWRAVRNFDTLVRSYPIEVPPSWTDLTTYLAEFKTALVELHGPLRAHPLEQSLRGGSQTTQHLEAGSHAAVRAFFAAVDAPIRHYLSELNDDRGPLQARNSGSYSIVGSWSVLLRQGGSHVDHVHPEGWYPLPSTLMCHARSSSQVRRDGSDLASRHSAPVPNLMLATTSSRLLAP